MSFTEISYFRQLFQGLNKAHGKTVYTEEFDKKGKRKTFPSTVSDFVYDSHYIAHIEGTMGLGIVPVNEEGKVSFAVIDIDDYTDNWKPIHAFIHRYSLPLHCFSSKSGGLHVYIFFKSPEEAKDVITLLTELTAIMGVHGTEIFPKQNKVASGKIGSWINLPYYGMGKYGQALLNGQGEKVEFSEGILYLYNRGRVSLKELENSIKSLPGSDGPPCLQSISLLAEPIEARNNFLFSYGVYRKAANPHTWQEDILAENNLLSDPLEESEVSSTIIQSLSKGEYSFKCSEHPCIDKCTKPICKKREYGISQGMISSLDFGELKQVLTDPPYYIWNVSNVPMKFSSEIEMIKQEKFQQYCMRHLHIVPNKLKQGKWQDIINSALSNIVTEQPENDDMSPGGICWEYIAEFLTRTSRATKHTGLEMGQVFRDNPHRRYLFKGKKLIEYITVTKRFKDLKVSEIREMLRDNGADDSIRLPAEDGTNRQIRAWSMPFEALSAQYSHVEEDEPIEEAKDIDFDDFNSNDGEW